MQRLGEAGLTQGQRTWHCDEMRFGLWGQVRRRWGCRGVKIIQKVQIEFAWQYLVLAVDVIRCELHWAWASRMNQVQLRPIFQSWSPDAVVWDGASAHRGHAMGRLGFARIFLPPYSPELNPPERVFEVLRQAVEGEVYPSLQSKRHAIERELRRLNANKPKLRSLIGWDWILDAFQQLPHPDIRSP
jgi:putative transposase